MHRWNKRLWKTLVFPLVFRVSESSRAGRPRSQSAHHRKHFALGGKRPARAGWARAGRGKGWKKGYFLAFLAGAFFTAGFLAGAFFAGAFLAAFLAGLSSGIS